MIAAWLKLLKLSATIALRTRKINVCGVGFLRMKEANAQRKILNAIIVKNWDTLETCANFIK